MAGWAGLPGKGNKQERIPKQHKRGFDIRPITFYLSRDREIRNTSWETIYVGPEFIFQVHESNGDNHSGYYYIKYTKTAKKNLKKNGKKRKIRLCQWLR